MTHQNDDTLLVTRVRERHIAHLILHGWEPVREIPSAITGHGLFNYAEGWGLRVTGLGTPKQEVRKLDTRRITPCAWDDITNEVLDIVGHAIRTWDDAP